MSQPDTPHYAEAFAPRARGCFRLVADAAGRRYRVQACDGHRGGLENARRLRPVAGT